MTREAMRTLNLEVYFNRMKYTSIDDFHEVMKKTLLELFTKYYNEIENSNHSSISAKRLNSLLKDYFQKFDELYDNTKKSVLSEMLSCIQTYIRLSVPKTSSLSARLSFDMIDEVFNVRNDNILGYSFDELFTTSNNAVKRKLKQTLSSNFVVNNNIPSYASSVFHICEVDSVNQIKTSIRTYQKLLRERVEVKTDEYFLKNGGKSFLGYKTISTLDSRTTPVCIALNNTFYPKEEYPTRQDIPHPVPRHFNCRSVIVRVFEDDDFSDSTRSSNGDKGGEQLEANISFEAFLRQNPQTAKDILGEKRYAFWQANKINIKSFVDIDKNKFFSIDEINRRFAGE